MNKDINLRSKEEQIELVTNYGWNIKYIKEPCYEVQLAAVNNNGLNIQYIKTPWYEVQLAAIQEKTNKLKQHFKFIKQYITYPDLLELLELKILACNI